MASAIGGLGAGSQSAHGQFWVDARDYGVKPGVGSFDNGPCIQAAHDALVNLIK